MPRPNACRIHARCSLGQPVERAAYASLDHFYNKGFGYAAMMKARPQTLGYALADSPVRLAAFFYDKFAAWTFTGGDPERALTRNEMLDDITLYWLTNTGTSSRSYCDAAGRRRVRFRALRQVPPRDWSSE